MDCETTVLDSVDAVRAYIDQCFSNSSLKENYRKVFEEHIEKINSNSAWLNSTLVGLTFVYILMMCIGFTGNILVIVVVICNRAMRVSPRNLFIFNLAVSDLVLCIVTQPLNLYRILSTRYGWQLGLPMCKLSSMVQATNVYVSSMSITAIALDRFRVGLIKVSHNFFLIVAVLNSSLLYASYSRAKYWPLLRHRSMNSCSAIS